MEKDSKIYIAGHLGLVGGGIWRAFQRHGYTNLLGRSIDEMDLTDQRSVDNYFAEENDTVDCDSEGRRSEPFA